MTKKAKTIEIIVNPDDNDALASNKECAEHWFSQSADIDPDAVAAAADADPNSLVYVCKCGVAKKSHPKIYTNRIDHLKRDHPGFRAEMANLNAPDQFVL